MKDDDPMPSICVVHVMSPSLVVQLSVLIKTRENCKQLTIVYVMSVLPKHKPYVRKHTSMEHFTFGNVDTAAIHQHLFVMETSISARAATIETVNAMHEDDGVKACRCWRVFRV
jgi:hypothetical protein